MKWKKARKKPVIIEFREVEPKQTLQLANGERVKGEGIVTLEGYHLAVCGVDYIIRGVKGEIYPIKKDIFYETYEVIEDESHHEPMVI